ncbi:MAG: hypothetical protein HXX15_17795 [Rhodopseudomonas sp.]|uniref:hypothetical protein n=1 Tax=Rhodopseudomonas sp. TaxID=1078 RepID=UPI001836D420|nr:hypothetical protein [Rhodopseudomonas sp.]NVN87935.1 hypothetical protein [Rhodopseudomonas sp.]
MLFAVAAAVGGVGVLFFAWLAAGYDIRGFRRMFGSPQRATRRIRSALPSLQIPDR